MEDVVRRHFILLRPLLERQLARWLDECQAERHKLAMEKAYVEIMELIDQAAAASSGAGSSGEGGGSKEEGAGAMEIS